MKNLLEKWTSITSILIMLLIINFFFINIPFLNFKLDLTRENFFTLSEGTKNIVQDLPDIVTIKAFISDDLPAQFSEQKSQILDLIREIESVDSSKVRLEVLSPEAGSDNWNQAIEYGIRPLTFQVRDGSSFTNQEGFLGLAIIYQDKVESIESLNNISKIEYTIALALRRVTNQENPSVAVFVSQEVSDSFQTLQELLTETYTPTRISDLSELNNYKGLIMVGAFENLSPEDILIIKEYIDLGNPALIFNDKVVVENGLQNREASSPLNELLTEYGFQTSKELVLDLSAKFATFRRQNGSSLLINYPYWLEGQPEFFNKESRISDAITAFASPWTNYILDNENITYLIRSTNKSWLSSTPPNLSPEQDFQPTEDSTFGPFTLIAKANDENLKLIVGATSRIFNDQFMGQFGSNLLLLLNSLDTMLLDENLLLIRNKEINLEPLPIFSDEFIKVYKAIFNIVIPLGIGIYGATYLNRRRKNSKIIQ